MKDRFTIGEMSALFNLNVQTLYYYDSVGVFQPDYRCPRSGRRYYAFDQVYRLASIRYLRKMGYSLDEVKRYLDNRSPEGTIELLKERSTALRRQWEELMRIDGAIRRKIQFIEQKRLGLDEEAVEVKWFPERRYLPLGSEEYLYMEDSFYFYPTIAFYEEDLKYFGAYLYVPPDGIAEEELAIRPEDTQLIPAGRFLVGYHRGPYKRVEERFAELRAARPDLRLSSRAINFNIIDQFVECNSENYVTEVQIQVLEE